MLVALRLRRGVVSKDDVADRLLAMPLGLLMTHAPQG